MANDDRVKIEPTKVEIDKEGLASDLKSAMPDTYVEKEVELGGSEPINRQKPETSFESVGSNGYEPMRERNTSESYTRTYDDDDYGRFANRVSSNQMQEQMRDHAQGEGLQKPGEQSSNQSAPTGREQPAAGAGPVVAPVAQGNNQQGNAQPQGNNVDPKNGGKEAPKIAGGGANPNMQQQPLDENGEPREKTEAEKKKEEKERADANNANNIRNAADVAIASKNPYAMAAGGIVKAADKFTGGKSTEMLGKAMTRANKMSPGGRRIQDASNKLNESGASDKIGQAAAAKNGDGASAGQKAADTAEKAKKAKDTADKAKQAGDKAKQASNNGSKAKGKVRGKNDASMSDSSGGSTTSREGTAIMDRLGKAVLHFFLRHPFALIVLIFLIFVFILLFQDEFEGNSSGHRYCSYELSGVTGTGTVKLDNVQVELINCDGSASNYTVLETIDFEKYVVGVALAEVSWHKDQPEYFKAAIVAARGFSLKRNSGMCPSNPDNCFFGYNVETGKIRMRACTNDQVYCDIDKPCYHYTRSGKPTIYGPEAAGMAGATVWKGQLDEATKAEILAAAEEVKGKVLVDSSGDVVNTNYVNTDQQHWWELAQQGKSYEEILVEHYSSKNATGMNSATCSNYGNIDYGDYQLSSEGDTILNERLDRFLESKGTSLQEFNQLIESNVKKNGYGTRAGVVTAAVTLIAELGNNYDTKVPYFLSGGHHDGVRQGALGYWGSGYEDDGRRCIYSGYGNIYTVCGLDCSGFVPWAIKNGGFQVGVRLAGDFQHMDGARRISLSSSSAVLEPGDLLESSGHIVLVVGIDESTHQYICAEASGKNSGVLFTRRPFTGGDGYWGVKMDGYYDKYSLAGK